MAEPKKRHTKARRDKRRSHLALRSPGLSIDKLTKSVHRPHHVDLNTGFYRGKQVLFAEEEDGEAGEA
ncbi:MAG: 50S ribosomal protein L32 [Planctomycetota bacterium]